jgi:hypothetical protein
VDFIQDLHNRKNDCERDPEHPSQHDDKHDRLDHPQGDANAMLGLGCIMGGKPPKDLGKHPLAALDGEDDLGGEYTRALKPRSDALIVADGSHDASETARVDRVSGDGGTGLQRLDDADPGVA